MYVNSSLMKKIFWSWTLLLVLAGGVLYMIGMGNIDTEISGPFLVASIVVTLTGTLLYARIKDKREGKRFLRIKRKS